MKATTWIKIWILALLVIPLVGVINYVIDPMAYNRKFQFSLNANKSRLDERIQKFNLMKEGDFECFVFGSSRNTIIDPRRMEKHSGMKSINMAFSAATMNEIVDYINYIIVHKKPRLILLPIDLFAFSEKFQSNGTMPKELSKDSPDQWREYLTLEMLSHSLDTVYYSLNQKISKEQQFYADLGMRYYKEFLEARKSTSTHQAYVSKNVTEKKPYWHVKDFSQSRFELFRDLIQSSREKKVEVKVFTNPLTIEQLQIRESFESQMKLLEKIVTEADVEVLDFNNLNEINRNHIHFIDRVHYNYEISNCIVDRIFTNKSSCAKDFGAVINKENFQSYKSQIMGGIDLNSSDS